MKQGPMSASRDGREHQAEFPLPANDAGLDAVPDIRQRLAAVTACAHRMVFPASTVNSSPVT